MYAAEVERLYKLLFLEEKGMTFSQSTSKMISPAAESLTRVYFFFALSVSLTDISG